MTDTATTAIPALLLLKLTITPLLVAGMSLVARRFGPAVGGLIMGLPWMTGPVLFFLALERGNIYLSETARGALLAIVAISAFGLVYAAMARRAGWQLSLAAAAFAFWSTGWAISAVTLPASAVAVMGAAALICTYFAIPKPAGTSGPRPMPWWDIPARMIATACLVAVIAASADYIGPTLSGIVSSYPVILTVVAVFTHKRWGADAAVALTRGVMLSLLGFVIFFWTIAFFVERIGLVPAYAAAAGLSLFCNICLLALNHRSHRTEHLLAPHKQP
jgi:hypothetical protein